MEHEPLSPYKLEAKAHWERFLPDRVKQLRAEGSLALENAIRAARWRTEHAKLVEGLANPRRAARSWTPSYAPSGFSAARVERPSVAELSDRNET